MIINFNTFLTRALLNRHSLRRAVSSATATNTCLTGVRIHSNFIFKRTFIQRKKASFADLKDFEEKKPTKPLRRKLFVKLFVVAELAFFIGSYLVWKRMNSSQEFRLYMKNNCPIVLEGKHGLIIDLFIGFDSGVEY